jgi:hypothetical protein
METSQKTIDRVRAMSFGRVYPLYVAKVERKGRTRDELDTVITWLTGYSSAQLVDSVATNLSCGDFFDDATMNTNAHLITGKICGVQVELIDDEFMKRVRQLDKVVDELAKGRAMEKILRG